MPFGLLNARTTYGRMTRKLLHGLEDVDNYVDDVIAHSQTWEKRMEVLRSCFLRLREVLLTMKPSKCQFGLSHVDFVGHKVGSGQVLTQSYNVETCPNSSY